MEYIPQGPPFEMIDTLLLSDGKLTRVSFTIPENNVLVQDGYFTEAGLLENMAQAAAAGTGYQAALTGAAPPVGFIGAVKNFEVKKLPPAGQTIITTATPLHQIMNARVIAAEVSLHGETIAQAEFKIFLQ
ncbi:MAG: 3-hydroxyacyl-ACP dehydratase [Edaphocola sp.]